MLRNNQYKLSWEHFNDLNPDRRIAFENLCRSLFQRLLCDPDTILHSDPNHPGVEVAPVFTKRTGKTISFQAKYFDAKVGYDQIETSANQTVKHYRGMIETVYLYSNKNITQTCQRYKDIEAIYNNAGIDVVLISGQTILEQASEFPTILATYFGLDYLDYNWFLRNLNISLSNLGVRYNNRFDIGTTAQRDLSIFLKEPQGIDSINGKKREVLSELDRIRWECDYELRLIVDTLITTIRALNDISANSIKESADWRAEVDKKCLNEISGLRNKLAELEKTLDTESNAEKRTACFHSINNIKSIFAALDILSVSTSEMLLFESKVLFVEGKMGCGKTQLLAATAKRLMDNNRLAVLVLGQTFISAESIEAQLLSSILGVNSLQSLESILCVMDEYASREKQDSVLLIDAINESSNPDIWKYGIIKLIELIKGFEHIKLVLSVRTGFEKITLNENTVNEINKSFALIEHRGFDYDTPEQIYDFLSANGIPFSPDYYLHADMSNPLFLTWFCKAYSGEERGMYSLINDVIDKADEEASKAAKSKEPYSAMRRFLCDILEFKEKNPHKELTREEMLQLPVWELYGITEKSGYIKAAEHFGMIASYCIDDIIVYYIGYNFLEEYIHAESIISRFDNQRDATSYLKNKLLKIDAEGKVGNYRNTDIFIIACSLCADKFGEDCIEIVDSIKDSSVRSEIVSSYIESYAWMRNKASLDYFMSIVNKYGCNRSSFWNVFIENSSIPNSELNADGLSKVLSSYSLVRRDYLWTTWINNLFSNDRIINLIYYFERANDFPDFSPERTRLILILFCWMLSSSNRHLRDHASRAMIELLKSRIDLCQTLLTHFENVNDPYIIQRLYGVVFGAIMKRTSVFENELYLLSSWIIEHVFKKDIVYPDMLLRNYARLIVERFAYEFHNRAATLDLKCTEPPYKSLPIPQMPEVNYHDKKYNADGILELVDSMAFDIHIEGCGLYGDFGRYVFQSALSTFANIDLKNIFNYSISFILDELGYTSETFGDYDCHLRQHDRHDTKKTERIGKKYQWIAMYNILARVSDVYYLKGATYQDKRVYQYSGPWNPLVLDFDPTINLSYGRNPDAPNIILQECSADGQFIPFDASDAEAEQWVETDSQLHTDFISQLETKDSNDMSWIRLYLYREAIQSPLIKETGNFGYSDGEQHIWIKAIAYAKPKSSQDELVKSIDYYDFFYNTYDIPSCHSIYFREYGWSKAYKEEFENGTLYYFLDGRAEVPLSADISLESEYDASFEEPLNISVPMGKIIKVLNLHPKKHDGYYYDGDVLVAYDVALEGGLHNEVMIRKDYLIRFLDKASYSLFWIVYGEKQFFQTNNQYWQKYGGVYTLNGEEIVGEIKKTKETR